MDQSESVKNESRKEKLERLRLQRENEKKKKESSVEEVLNNLNELEEFLKFYLDEKSEEVIPVEIIKKETEKEREIEKKPNKIKDLIDKFNKK